MGNILQGRLNFSKLKEQPFEFKSYEAFLICSFNFLWTLKMVLALIYSNSNCLDIIFSVNKALLAKINMLFPT